MVYKDFQDLKLSALGVGCMRLPVVGNDDGKIDEAAAAEMAEYAVSHGINYFDTAWGYHEGNSETVMGKILEKYPGKIFIWHQSFRDMTFQICRRRKKSLRNSWKNAALSILTSICSTMFAR